VKKPIPFGKYVLLERINVGGMAEVFKAKAFGVEGFERLVAVKRILPSIAEDTEFITMFIDEAKIAVQLTHANIAQIFDLGRVADSYFIAMEYVHGKDLRAIFDRARKRGEPLPVPMACYCIMKVCEGLDYAHNKRDPAGRDLHLVHRDVSPQNLLISYDGEVKIIDFGIAKAAGKAGKTQAGILKGKFGYMSPEQVRGLPLDRRSDIFAVGICLYELLTGERLFVGESDFSTLEKVRNVEIMPPSTYNRRIPEELEQIVLKALAKDVDDRYQTAMDLHDDLQSFMYTSGNFFARKDLSAFQRKMFAEEIAKESARDEHYRRMDVSGSSGLDAFDDLPPPESDPPRAPPPPASMSSNPGGAPRGGPGPKRTMMGMGAVPPPPPPRASGGPSGGPPPPPVAQRVSHPGPPPPPSAQTIPGPVLEMDWDEEELSTQIYDKPDGLPGVPTTLQDMPAVRQPQYGTSSSPSMPVAPPPRSSGQPSPFAFSQPPGSPSAAPELTGPRLPPPTGAPSPFGPPSIHPSDSPRRAPEPTAVTRAERPKKTGLFVALGAAAFLLVGAIAVVLVLLLGSKEPGQILVTTEPRDAVVLFDEVPVRSDTSPFLIEDVAPGEHFVEVSKVGFQNRMERVEVTAGETVRLPPITLEPVAGSGTGFALDTRPSGARVFVDGRELPERTPIRVTDLAPGSHTIRVDSGSRYTPWETTIDVRENAIVELPQAVLNLSSVTVQFRSDPVGAAVTLVRGEERRSVGSTPTSADVPLTGGAWTVEMSRDLYETWSETLSPPAGQEEFEVRATLERAEVAVRPVDSNPRDTQVYFPMMNAVDPVMDEEPTMDVPTMEVASGGSGTLQVNSVPWSQVYVDGRLIGNTPQMGISLRAGSHRVTLVNPDFDIRHSFSVNIAAGETVRRVERLPVGG
jgi:eukaryotic-like serine/threonine-protein kinase